jgi:hypothetical protein
MSDDNNPPDNTSSTQVIRDLLDAYSKLVAIAAEEIHQGKTAEFMGETVDGLTEKRAKLILKTRIMSDAMSSLEALNQEGDDPLGLGGNPVLN